MLKSFKKPFRAAPVKLGDHYRRKQRDADQKAAVKLLSLATVLGAIVGMVSLALNEDGRAKIGAAVRLVAEQAGVIRARDPQPGNFWRGCDDARAAGTAPIYSNELGYREKMDGGGDGVACEPCR